MRDIPQGSRRDPHAHRARAPELVRERRLALAGLLGAALLLALLLLLLPSPWQVPTGPGFLPGGTRRTLGHMIRIGEWWAALVNLLLVAALALALPLWLRPVTRRPEAPGWRPARRWWAVLAAIVALAAMLRWPLAGRSLWWDEAWSIQRVVVGAFVESGAPAQQAAFKPVGLRHALWSYRKPTNHVAYNVAAWAADRIWRVATHPSPWVFSERVFRAPAWLAGLAGIAATAWLGALWGWPGAGLGAAILLALHPWHHRYGVEGRAYSFVLALLPLAAISLTRFLQRPTHARLIAYSASIGLLLWSFPYSVLLVATWGLVGLVALARQEPDPASALGWGLRFGVAHLIVAMGLLQLLAPNLMQLGDWHYTSPRVASSSLRELWAGLSLGLPYRDPGEGFASLSGSPARAWLAGLVLPLLAALGAWRALRRRIAAPVVLAWLLAAPVSFGVNALIGQQFFPRYGLFLLPLYALLLALAFAPSTPGARGRPWGFAALLVAFALAVAPQLRVLLQRPYAPMREVARRVARERSATRPPALTVGYGLGGGMPHIYDPELLHVRDLAGLRELCERARREQRPLIAFYGYPRHNRRARPAGLALLEDPRRFVPIAEYEGIEAEFHYRILRWTGHPCSDAP